MEGINIVDVVVIVVIILSAILAYARGFVREVMAIAGWIAAAVVAYIFAPQAEPLIKQIPVLDKFLAGSCELSIIAAFAVVFALALVVLAFFTPLLSSAVQNSVLGGFDRGLGFLFGVARGILLVAVALIVYDRAMAGEAIPQVAQSQSAHIFANFQAKLNSDIPDQMPRWLENTYEGLVGDCGAPPKGADGVTGNSGATGTGATTLTPPAPKN
ncbi:CvpA family protein [Acidimangrovimonas sediminis]|uniref:CvpA family protein n=1 Tax=Acidimangrovimonas sediminis TaxID=2056283 RepID=UPI000C801843|nr:CvpA family protein [Acidimangrovimonas sediminis]